MTLGVGNDGVAAFQRALWIEQFQLGVERRQRLPTESDVHDAGAFQAAVLFQQLVTLRGGVWRLCRQSGTQVDQRKTRLPQEDAGSVQ